MSQRSLESHQGTGWGRSCRKSQAYQAPSGLAGPPEFEEAFSGQCSARIRVPGAFGDYAAGFFALSCDEFKYEFFCCPAGTVRFCPTGYCTR